MSAFLLKSKKRSREPGHSVVAVTNHNALAFYDLIQEQALVHTSTTHGAHVGEMAHRLSADIQKAKIHAFMVYNGEIPLGAVTFTRCQIKGKSSLYLEDIITTQQARGHGVGHFAMSALSQIALTHGYDDILLECGADKKAQKFYTSLGASYCDDRLTWRFLGAATGEKNTCANDRYIVAPMSMNVVEPAALLLGAADRTAHNKLVAWLRDEAVNPYPAEVFMVARDASKDKVVGMIYGYHSFSTFRVKSGLHVGGLFVEAGHEVAATTMLQGVAHLQYRHNWTGHTDITLEKSGDKLLETLKAHGYQRLAYGDDRMLVRKFDRQALENLLPQTPIPIDKRIVANFPRRKLSLLSATLSQPA